MKRPVKLATVGYQGATVRSFLDALGEAGVDLLVDVRAVASSRRAGFAKSALAANLEAAGIEYLHLRDLGTPAPGRAAARAGRHAEMRRIYRKHLKTEAAQSAMGMLASIVRSRHACLLCFEADPTHCHRSLVADALGGLVHLRITHLAPALAHPHLRPQGLEEDD
ncbi:MAG TPA: DUF488 domain-containing protein [Gemmatimonadales bacterium]|jgi:uncharacterized protein (DUF488 family)